MEPAKKPVDSYRITYNFDSKKSMGFDENLSIHKTLSINVLEVLQNMALLCFCFAIEMRLETMFINICQFIKFLAHQNFMLCHHVISLHGDLW